ncbi:hypothetical protein U1Q18_032410 [Sarracenia purpurea var. burkii]
MQASSMKPGRISVPAFGGWDRKAAGATDYSMVFSQARADRKQHKSVFNHHSIGNEQELMVKQQEQQQHDSVMVRLLTSM